MLSGAHPCRENSDADGASFPAKFHAAVLAGHIQPGTVGPQTRIIKKTERVAIYSCFGRQDIGKSFIHSRVYSCINAPQNI